MLIGRRSKENSSGASNSVMELLPKRKPNGPKQLAETPQKLKAEILYKNREIEHLRRLLDQNKKDNSRLGSPRQKLFSCDCFETHRQAIKKIEDCIVLIRQHSWSEKDQTCTQEALDFLQASLALFFAPISTKARMTRRHSMTSCFSTDDLSVDGSENLSVDDFKRKIAEYAAKLECSMKHEQEIEAVVEKLGEACRLSEARASDFQAKCESLHAAVMIERKNAASLLIRVQQSEDDRANLREDVIRLNGEIEELQARLKQSQKASDRTNEAMVEMKIMAQKIEALSRNLSREKEFSEVQAYTIERLEKENSSLSRSIAERDERIRNLVCSSYKAQEAERELLLNRISIANTAVSTLQLELQLKQNDEAIDEESDEEGASENSLSANSQEVSPKNSIANIWNRDQISQSQDIGKSGNVHRNSSKTTVIPLFLLSTHQFPGYNSVQLVTKCLSPSMRA